MIFQWVQPVNDYMALSIMQGDKWCTIWQRIGHGPDTTSNILAMPTTTISKEKTNGLS